MLKLTAFGEEYNISLRIANYGDNGNLAIQMICHDEDGFSEPFAMLTVNLHRYILPNNQAYLDTNYLGIEIGKWVADNGLGEYIGEVARSGFCSYPLFEFNLEKVKEHGT